MESIHISENSGAYMIDSTGTTIADTTLDTVSVQNIEQEAQQDSSLSAAALHADMRAGNSGYGSYEISGARNIWPTPRFPRPTAGPSLSPRPLRIFWAPPIQAHF